MPAEAAGKRMKDNRYLWFRAFGFSVEIIMAGCSGKVTCAGNSGKRPLRGSSSSIAMDHRDLAVASTKNLEIDSPGAPPSRILLPGL